MNKCIYKYLAILTMLPWVFCNFAYAQDDVNERAESSVAILNTAIPFAIGAREGEQSIRGSFGWPTFQEGFVDGVYFRFDPDGYARFSKSPRLDEDVFEVLCEAGSTKCVAKKNGMEISLTDQGQPHINIAGLTSSDHFFLSDRKAELPLPNTIVSPLDQRLEALFSSGGDLIIRRELETLQTLSLSGLAATVTYLRWVAQNQSSFVFPRGWPVPSQQIRGQQGLEAKPLQNQIDRWGGVSVQSSESSEWKLANATNLRENKTELPAVEFAQQAQGRNLTSDVNKFTLSSQTGTYDQSSYKNSQSAKNISAGIRSELSEIYRLLNSLDVKLNNLIQQVNYEGQHSVNIAQRNVKQPRIFQTYNQAQTQGTVHKTDDEKMREAVIKSILADVQDEDNSTSKVPEIAKQGEVSVKKSIVERLLEELNGDDESKQSSTEKAATPNNEFISLSDYINKVMQDETQQ